MGFSRKYFWPMDTRTLRDTGCQSHMSDTARPTRQARESQDRRIFIQKPKPSPIPPLARPPASDPCKLQFPNPIQSLALDSILAKVRRSTPSVAASARAAARANVIEIPSSPDQTAGAGGSKKGRKRAPPAALDLDGVEMWTPRQKRRLDDECCILAADPLAADEAPAVAPAAADDVAVVAERGKVACRDYPHPRSACARYPFSSTPHESHCKQCFCYVCDIAAPCVSWKGYGGHCHASDKDKKWKTMRMARQRQCK